MNQMPFTPEMLAQLRGMYQGQGMYGGGQQPQGGGMMGGMGQPSPLGQPNLQPRPQTNTTGLTPQQLAALGWSPAQIAAYQPQPNMYTAAGPGSMEWARFDRRPADPLTHWARTQISDVDATTRAIDSGR